MAHNTNIIRVSRRNGKRQSYYDATDVSLEEVLRLWVEEGIKASEGPYMVAVSKAWPAREYTWSRSDHRSGAVPGAGKYGEKWIIMPGVDRGRQETITYDPGPEYRVDNSNRWDALKAYMKKHGWVKADPGHIFFGKNGIAKVGEGNHRLSVARELGIEKVPMCYHFWEKVTLSPQH